MPPPEHPAEDRLARRSGPEGEAVWGPGSPKEDGSICDRSWCFHLAVVIEEEGAKEFKCIH